MRDYRKLIARQRAHELTLELACDLEFVPDLRRAQELADEVKRILHGLINSL